MSDSIKKYEELENSLSMKETTVTLFRYLRETNTPYHLTLDKLLNRIKIGKSKALVMELRGLVNIDKPLYDKKKTHLPAILFGGKFTIRGKEHCEIPSGLMTLDYDKFLTTKTMDLTKDELKKNPHVVSIFYSPSFKGLKVLVKIPITNKNDYSKYFKQFNVDFKNDYFDYNNSDISRVCFESYDPDIYINYDAVTYEPVLIEQGYTVEQKVPLFPINDEMEIIDKIMCFNWKKDFNEGERNSYIFDLAGAFCEYGVSQDTAIGYISNNIVIGSFSETETNNAIKSAYKKRSFDIKYFEDYKKRNSILADLPNGKNEVIKKHNLTEDVYQHISEENEISYFWYFDKNGDVKIDLLKYKFFLEHNGYKKYFQSSVQKPIYVKIYSNIVEEVSAEKIKDFTLNYLIEQKEFKVWRRCANYQNIFTENFLVMLDSIELLMLQDTKDTSYIAYKNGILKITENKRELIDYPDVNGYLWRKSIIDRDFVISENVENEYKIFIKNVSDNNPYPIECTLGYLLYRYKNKTNVKAVILNDEIISENPEGGTGKGLLVQGLKRIRNVSILDGKSFDDTKSFAYQTVGPETDILVFDDAKKNFDFESKFSLVTEGMTLERKNKDAVKLTVEESPKLLISTNYAIRGSGNSHDRRRHEIEIAQYYNKNLTPRKEFGHELFDDWSEEEFNRFDNYMSICIQSYFKNGLMMQTAKNIEKRKLIAETSMEFIEFISDRDLVPLNIRHDKATKYSEFIQEYPDFQKWLRRKRFNIWVSKYADFEGLKYIEGKTSNNRWFTIYKDGEQLKNENEDTIFDI